MSSFARDSVAVRRFNSFQVSDGEKVSFSHGLFFTLKDTIVEDKRSFCREPVDTLEHPEYHQIIDTPMDLRTVKEDLLGGNYETPLEFAKDMRLIFINSRNYNTNKRSKVGFFYHAFFVYIIVCNVLLKVYFLHRYFR